MMAASQMSLGGLPPRGAGKAGVLSQGSGDLSSLSTLDLGGEDEAERLRKKRLAIFKSKYEVDEKIVSRHKALINLTKVAPAHSGPLTHDDTLACKCAHLQACCATPTGQYECADSDA
jgi:hypothetical protein